MMENTRGWHKGAPCKADFNGGELLVISQRGGYYFCHNEDEQSNLYLLEQGEYPVYWMPFDMKLSLPEGVYDVFVHFHWTQRGTAEVRI